MRQNFHTPCDGSIYTKKNYKKNIFSAHLPECPPNVETHCVQPEESSQKEEMNANS